LLQVASEPRSVQKANSYQFNHPTFGGKDWKNLVDNLDWSKERPKWFAGF